MVRGGTSNPSAMRPKPSDVPEGTAKGKPYRQIMSAYNRNRIKAPSGLNYKEATNQISTTIGSQTAV
jgi:hypothetical protein